MVGVHTAYELAQLGFRVIVFEQCRAIGLGATQYAFPFVGVGLLQPYIHTIRMGRKLLRGTLAVICPDIISAEDSWNSFFFFGCYPPLVMGTSLEYTHGGPGDVIHEQFVKVERWRCGGSRM
ncbi:hypothetical protein TraAM80_02845 [Trypanosoma rangeli]|uniref:FAD dependent oxidoreductase domain-containing protein n=1 Tax=Trypanosoma rangeli TaxID=5698 RepID=A0A422NSC4_TRYRA|nr:uncharacterized protein TraAM80_02845 [Trypanosoma rangeli]RNF08385.1 hypothetical protein TraAM80_02845 [Trypanosoma rangeli]|eukprot:RNF08385.1 hypothetical protein TraAM80_02845 [Trypanosoma rangeli]